MVKLNEGLLNVDDFASIILETSPVAIFTVDLKKRVTSWNRKAETITGYSREEVLGKECILFANFPCSEKCGLYSENVIKPITGAECTIKTKDERTLIIVKNVDYLKDKNGNVIGGIESFADITERKHASEKIAQAASEWQRTFDSITDLIFILDKDSTILKANSVFFDKFKLTKESVIGRKCYELVHKSDKPWPLCPHVAAMGDGTAHSAEIYDPVLEIPLLVSVSPIFDDNGRCIGSVHIAKDISEISKARREIEEKVKDLERFQKVTMGREKRIIELKDEIAVLRKKLEETQK